MVTTASIVQTYRLRKNLSRVQLGLKTNLSSSYISRIELGERGHQRRETLTAIAAALDIPEEQQDHLLISACHAPDWATDVTVRQLVFLIRNLPANQQRLLRKRIQQVVTDISCTTKKHREEIAGEL